MNIKMPYDWYKELISLCSIQSYSSNEKRMVVYIWNWLLQRGLQPEIDAVGNILISKGNTKTYPCIVSHLDTVHKIKKDYKVVEKIIENKLVLSAISNNKFTGIGGDDKCGILACLYFLDTLSAVKVVFFTQEETGCKGSNGVDDSFFNNCRYILQLDRKGNKDFIDKYLRNDTTSHSFRSEIGHILKNYGFKRTTGIWTDVINLWDKEIGISCANISSGYYKPHSNNEYIVINELWNSIKFTEAVIKKLKPKIYPSVPPKLNTITTNNNNKYKLGTEVCNSCGTTEYKHCGKIIKDKWYCYDCMIWDDSVGGWTARKELTKNITEKLGDVIKYNPHHDYKKCENCGFWSKDVRERLILTPKPMTKLLCNICNLCR